MADEYPPFASEGRNRAPAEVPQDLGFGSVVSNRRGYRLLNRDGSFNVRVQKGQWRALSYHKLLSLSWTWFFAFVLAAYLAMNFAFALAYLACGANALTGDAVLSPMERAFFFSVHTFATIGYGNVTPYTLAANVVVTVESLVGLMALALATGMVFARFSRPVADIRYSRRALVAPYRDITALMFRVANARDNQLVNVEAVVMFSRFEGEGAGRHRQFTQLSLERKGIAFFPLNWTVVHPIDRSSPLWGWDRRMLLEAEAEFAILLTAVDETFAQTVHSRSSYTAEEVDFGFKFEMMYSEEDRNFVLDMDKIDAVKRAPLAEPTVQ